MDNPMMIDQVEKQSYKQPPENKRNSYVITMGGPVTL